MWAGPEEATAQGFRASFSFYVCIGYWSQLGQSLTEVVSNHLKGCLQSVGRGSVWPFEVPAGTVMAVFPYSSGVNRDVNIGQ